MYNAVLKLRAGFSTVVAAPQQQPAFGPSSMPTGWGAHGSRRRAMPFDIWSELVVTALCGASLVVWIGRDLAARVANRGQNRPYLNLRSSNARTI